MILRNVILTEMSLSKAPNKPHVGSLKFRFDMTVLIAQEMGWDCLYFDGAPTNGWDTLPLKGDIALVKATFKPSKRGGEKGEVTVTTCASFSAHRLKDKDGGGTSFYLSAILRSADDTFEAVMGAYWRGVGEGASQLTLSEAQANLFTGAEDEAVPLKGDALDEHAAKVQEILDTREKKGKREKLVQ